MIIKVRTEHFKVMVARSVKGASRDKIVPITGFMEISFDKGTLVLTTTDSANTLKVQSPQCEGDDGFYAVVPAEVFGKLVSRTTAEQITLEVKEDIMIVKSDGVYKLSLPIDESGLVKFPAYAFKKAGKGSVAKLTTIQNVIDSNRAAVGKNIETPYLTSYYVAPTSVITTDENVITFNNIKMFDKDVLISPQMMELIALNTQEDIKWWSNNGYLYFETPEVTVHGPEHIGKEVFPVEEVSEYLKVEFPSVCELPKTLIEDILDRLLIFVEPYDKNGAYFTFTEEGLVISSRQGTSSEIARYTKSEKFAPFTCCVDVPLLLSQVQAVRGQVFNLWYGQPAALKLTSGNLIQVVALLEDENI